MNKKNNVLGLKFQNQVEKDRQEIKNILEGNDKRFLVILGPCSAWPASAFEKYIKKLAVINDEVKEKIKIVLRIYSQKPRTVSGWNGPLISPNPWGKPNKELGYKFTFNLIEKALIKKLAVADEMLFLEQSKKILPFLSWVALGARSSEDQMHRNFIASLDIPAGIKNPTSGSIEKGLESVQACQSKQANVFEKKFQISSGNAWSHLVLRGGEEGNNLSDEKLEKLVKDLENKRIKKPAFLIDVSHGNCLLRGKKYSEQQIKNVKNILKKLEKKPSWSKFFRGFMIESFIKSGNQEIKNKKIIDWGGLSITDPCISWEETERILREIKIYLTRLE